jgi:hypothetical protein
MAERQWLAARGASVAVFAVAFGVLVVAVPAWARHTTDYESSGPHDTAMFGDPAAWAVMLLEATVGPIVFVAVGVLGAYLVSLRHEACFGGRCARRQIWMQALACYPTGIGVVALTNIPFPVLAIPTVSLWLAMVSGSTAWFARSSVERSLVGRSALD